MLNDWRDKRRWRRPRSRWQEDWGTRRDRDFLYVVVWREYWCRGSWTASWSRWLFHVESWLLMTPPPSRLSVQHVHWLETGHTISSHLGEIAIKRARSSISCWVARARCGRSNLWRPLTGVQLVTESGFVADQLSHSSRLHLYITLSSRPRHAHLMTASTAKNCKFMSFSLSTRFKPDPSAVYIQLASLPNPQQPSYRK